MKRVTTGVVLALLILVGALIQTFLPRDLAVGDPPALVVPAAPVTDLELRVLHTGTMFTRAALAFRGGSFLEARDFPMPVLLVEHPHGRLLIDAGFGREVDAHFLTTPKLLQWTSSYTRERSVAEQLPALGLAPADLDGVILTHVHWDHVSGLDDLAGVPVWVTAAERDFIDSGHEAVTLAAQIGTDDYRVYDFPDGPYLGFQRSRDWFGDGSLVIVPAAGHTPGSVVVFVNTPAHRLALIGDLAWQIDGVNRPAEKPWIARRAADHDAASLQRLLIHLHHLQAGVPGLQVLPSHDQESWRELERRLATLPAPPS